MTGLVYGAGEGNAQDTQATEGAGAEGQVQNGEQGANAQTGTQQAATDANAAAAEGEGAKKAAPAVPEKYELKLPEGYALDDSAMAELEPILRELGASNEVAQKLSDLHVKQMAASTAAFENARKEIVTKWGEELTKDAEIGGAKLAENLGFGKKVVEKFGSKEVMTLLEETGLGSHPSLVKMFVRIGRELSEDSFAGGSAPPAEAKNSNKEIASMLFPNSMK